MTSEEQIIAVSIALWLAYFPAVTAAALAMEDFIRLLPGMARPCS